jgi:Flp pilus assembly protein CpaB
MKRRSTLLMGIGVAVFVLGAGLVLLSLKHGKASQSVATSPAASPAPVVVATKAMPAGTTGEALIEAGAVALAPAPTGSYRADDLTSIGSLNQQALTGAVAPGQPIEASNLHTDAGDLTPPAGDESVAVTIPSGAAGVAGYIAPGDDVDVYGVVDKVTGNTSMPVPCIARLYTKVQVLDVSTQVAPYRTNKTTAGRSTPGSITFFLAVTPAQAQTLIFYTTNEGLYLTTAASSPPPSGSTACPALVNSPQLTPAP